MKRLVGLNADFRDILCALADAGAEFAVVGAYALAVHGVPRATGDIDVLVRPTEQNAARVLAALVEFGAPISSADVTAADFARAGNVYQIGVPPRRIDLLTEISGVTFEEVRDSQVERSLDGRVIPFIGRDVLRRNKAATGRTKDRADVEALDELDD